MDVKLFMDNIENIQNKNKIKNFLKGIILIFLVQFFSYFILKLLKIPFPSAILGIIILFFLLKFKIIKEIWIKDFCNFLIKNMILFFIPFFVGIVCYSDIILKNFWAIILTIFLTTTFVIVFVGLFVENVVKFTRLLKFKKRKKKC